MSDKFLTVPVAARELGQPDWKVRRAVDSLGNVPRAGLTRLVPREMLPKVNAICLSHGSRKAGK